MTAAPMDRSFPRPVLLGAAALLLSVMAMVGFARLQGGPAQPSFGVPAQSRSLGFEDRDDGSILVHDRQLGRPIAVLEPGTNGFIRATLRGLARDRRREDLGAEVPFRLARWPDGRLTLEDPATGRVLDLAAFGHTNVGAFARLLEEGGRP